MKRKALSMLIIVVMLISSLTISVSADTALNGSCGKDATWLFDSASGKLTISGTGQINPFSNNNIFFTVWNEFETEIKTLIIEDGITSIYGYTFRYCSNLTNISIPDSVKSIGSNAFTDTAYYSDSNNWVNDVLYIGNHLIKAKTTLSGDYEISPSTVCIADDAFRSCSSLTRITIPDGVTSIGEYTFSYCTSLSNVTIPHSVASIGYGAFIDCELLESITLPENITAIGDFAFNNCGCLTSVVIPNGVTSIGGYAFDGCTMLETITIPDSVTSIGNGAFTNTSYYNKPKNWKNEVLYIGNHLIEAKATLSGDYEISPSTVCIAEWAFDSCKSLTSVTIPDGITSISERAFNNCTALTNVTIPKSVTSIGKEAFYGCSSVTDIYYGSTEAKWENINIMYHYEGFLPNATIHYTKEIHTCVFTGYVYNNDATCTKDGTETATCECGKTDTRTKAGTAAHDFGDYSYNNDATTERDGTQTAKCKKCTVKDTKTKAGTKLKSVKTSEIFTDVKQNSWYEEYVDYAVSNNLFKGITDTTFEPNTEMNRGMFVTVLSRIVGYSGDKNVKTKFTDVPTGKYYTAPIKWASDNGIVTGINDSEFGPTDNVTREQMCTMLVRFADFCGIEITPTAQKAAFSDDAKIKNYAKEAVYICQMAGIVNGMPDGSFDPAGKATRAQVAKILTVFHKNYM